MGAQSHVKENNRSSTHCTRNLSVMKGDASISCSLNLIELRLSQLRFRKGRALGEREKMGLTADLRPSSNSQEDYKELRNALRGLCCNEKKVIEILGRRNQAQRDRIAHGYKRVFGESLRKRLKAAIRGKALEKCLSLWMLEPAKRDAVLLHEALKGGPNKDRAVIGMFCTRTPGQIYQIKHAYYALFNQTLENHIDGSAFESPEPPTKSKCALWRSSCAFWRSPCEPKTKDPAPQRAFAITKLLLALAGGSRPGNAATVDGHVAFPADAHPLSNVCTGKLLFSAGSSYGQLTATMNYYHMITTLLQHYGYDFEKPLSKKDTGEFLQALRAVVQCLHHPSKFYAEELSIALSGAESTDEEMLIQIITTQAEVDMRCIKVEFKKECQRSLEEAIAGKTTGNFRQFLLAVINQEVEDEPLFSTRQASKDSTASNYTYVMSTRTPNGSRQASDHSSQNYGPTCYFTSSVVSNDSLNSFQSSPWRLSSPGAYCKGALPKM